MYLRQSTVHCRLPCSRPPMRRREGIARAAASPSSPATDDSEVVAHVGPLLLTRQDCIRYIAPAAGLRILTSCLDGKGTGILLIWSKVATFICQVARYGVTKSATEVCYMSSVACSFHRSSMTGPMQSVECFLCRSREQERDAPAMQEFCCWHKGL